MEKLQIAKDLIKRRIIDIGRKIESLNTAMDMVVLTLKVQKDFPEPLVALELFGMHGLWLTADYAPLCDYLEFWEIEPMYAKFARRYFSKLNAVVKIGDSIKAVKEKRLLRENYNFIVIDNPIWSPYGQGYYEHFDLFPDIFDCLGPKGVLVINVLSNMDICAIALNKGNIAQQWIDRRKEFYGINEDKGVINLDVKKIIDVYKNKVPRGKFNITSNFFVPRNLFMGHLVVVVERNG